MKQYIFGLLFLFVGLLNVQGQIIENPVKWSYSSEKVGDGEYQLKFEAKITQEHWHIYSSKIDPNIGPYPTAFYYTESNDFKLVGDLNESEPIVAYDKAFEATIGYFDHGAKFKQKIKITKPGKTTVTGEIEWMVCNDETCLPPELFEFKFELEGPAGASTATTSNDATIEDNTVTDNVDETIPDETVIEEPSEEKSKIASNIADQPKEESKASQMSFWAIFVAGFGGGLLALFMPCIFPMIPLTVSFFTKQSKTKAEGISKASIYGISIIAIYVGLGLLVSWAFGPSALNAFSTNPWVNVGFFVLFVIFAISFFGAFEITLPSSWVNKADDASNKGGLIGIFFMAFTLSLVSFSCTGPIIGLLLVEAGNSGNLLGPAIGMFGFSLALAIPFTIFAIFPGWLNSMPKSGGWLNTVKVTLGFVELAFAFKFLSTADLVWQTHFLEREMFLAIWVAILFMLVLYLLGVFIMPLDSKVDRVSVPRMLFAMVFTILAFYILPGIWGAPVKLIAGFPPPEYYSESPGGAFAGGGHATVANPDASDFDFGDKCPLGINCFNDFDEGLKYAKKVNKPILIDFTGHGCVNCRKMEENVWVDPTVHKILAEKYVLVSLYVDARAKLPEDAQYISEVTGKKIKTVGNKWSEFQTKNYQANAQPYYVVVGHESVDPIIETRAFDLDVEAYKSWLNKGVAAFEK